MRKDAAKGHDRLQGMTLRLLASATVATLLLLVINRSSTDRRQQASGSGGQAALQGSLKPRSRGLPYLFESLLEPGVENACGHCKIKDPTTLDTQLATAGPDGPPHIAGPGPFCCGVCQFEGHLCSKMAPRGAVEAMVATYQRDFGFVFDAFQPSELFERIRGRTLWFIGDSQTFNSYYAAECFLREYALDYIRRPVTNDTAGEKLLRHVKGAEVVASMCIHLRNTTRICNVRINDGKDVGNILEALMDSQSPEQFPRDLAIVNFGLHYQPGTRLRDDVAQFHSMWATHREKLPTMIWRDVSVQHFATAKGAYDPASLGRQCQPLKPFYDGDPATVSGGPYNNAIAPAVRNMTADGIYLLITWNASVPLWNMHRAGECTHWCQPSAYHVWLYLLNDLMRVQNLGNAVQSP